MKKLKWIFCLLVMAVFLAGCVAKNEELQAVPEQPEETARAEEPEQAEAGPTRELLSKEALLYMHAEGRSNGFEFGGVEEDGAFYYEFTRPEEPDFYLRISDDFETALVSFRGNTMRLNDRSAPNGSLLEWNISAGYGGAVSGYGMPFWADMTGDGQPHGQLLRSLYYHPAVPVTAVLATVYMISQTLWRMRGRQGWVLRYDHRWPAMLVGLFLANCAVRNVLWLGFGIQI